MPTEFVPQLNKLLSLRHQLGADSTPEDIAHFRTSLKEWTATVESFLRAKEGFGLSHRPTTLVEVGLLMVQELKEMNVALAQLNDTICAAVGYPDKQHFYFFRDLQCVL